MENNQLKQMYILKKICDDAEKDSSAFLNQKNIY